MKKKFEKPVIEIIEINNDDVITTSTYDPCGIMGDPYDNWYDAKKIDD